MEDVNVAGCPTPLQVKVPGEVDYPIDLDDQMETLGVIPPKSKRNFNVVAQKKLAGDSRRKKMKEAEKGEQSQPPDFSFEPAEPSVHVGVESEFDDTESNKDFSEVDSPYEIEKILHPLFYTRYACENREKIAQKTVKPEKFADVVSFNKYGMDVFLQEKRLWVSVSNVHLFDPVAIQEFYTNLVPDVGSLLSSKYGEVFLRGKIYKFSPVDINAHLSLDNDDSVVELNCLDEVISVLTGGNIKVWSPNLAASNLSCLYAVLHKLVVFNWLPTTNTTSLTLDQAVLMFKIGRGLPFNMGKVIFDYALKAASKTTHSSILPYPCLIFSMLTAQGFKVVEKALVNNPIAFSITKNLLGHRRFQDLPYVSRMPPHVDASNTAEEDVSAAPTDMVSISAVDLIANIAKIDSLILQGRSVVNGLVEMRTIFQGFLSVPKGGDDAGGAGASGS